MENYKQKFIRLSLEIGALKFGEFQLKSGRISPYFFNLGLFSSGPLIKNIGDFYAATLVSSNINYDIVFGPAYKGIPIVTALASSLSTSYQLDKPFVYNRKEKKNHGEGGVTVGEELRGNVVIVDDVITAGTAIREAFGIINNSGATTTGIVISLDRQEKGTGNLSAAKEISNALDIPVISIVNLDEVIDYIDNNPSDYGQHIDKIKKYREEYGA
jgi:orotate phosphoribosyltransferase